MFLFHRIASVFVWQCKFPSSIAASTSVSNARLLCTRSLIIHSSELWIQAPRVVVDGADCFLLGLEGFHACFQVVFESRAQHRTLSVGCPAVQKRRHQNVALVGGLLEDRVSEPQLRQRRQRLCLGDFLVGHGGERRWREEIFALCRRVRATTVRLVRPTDTTAPAY